MRMDFEAFWKLIGYIKNELEVNEQQEEKYGVLLYPTCVCILPLDTLLVALIQKFTIFFNFSILQSG